MNSDYIRLRTALLVIAAVSDREWRSRGQYPLRGPFTHLNRELLEKQLPKTDHKIEIPLPTITNRLFLLPPTGHSVCALLAVNWEFPSEDEGSDRLREQRNVGDTGYVSRAFRVFLMPANSAADVAPTVFRFDEKEGNDDWCFAHAQLCDRVTPYNGYFDDSASTNWVSARLPRIPLAATQGPAPIFVCLLASLYGIDNRLFRSVLQALADKEAHGVAQQLSGR